MLWPPTPYNSINNIFAELVKIATDIINLYTNLTTHLPLPHPIRKGAQLKARDGIQVQEYFFQDNVSSKSNNDETSSFHCRSISYGEISVRGRDLVLCAFALIFGDGQLSMRLRIDHHSAGKSRGRSAPATPRT